jgi:serine/threonine protein kinase
MTTGEIKDPSCIPHSFSFGSMITNMSGKEKNRFVCFIERMIVWSPEERDMAAELLNDPWLYSDFLQS